MKISNNIIMVVLLSFLSLPAYALESEELPNEDSIYVNNTNNHGIRDPFEKFNRSVFKFNKGLDTFFLKPVALTYKKLIPQFGQDRVHNFLQNLTEPVNFINGILQFDPKKSTTAISRFFINTFLGLFGIHDVASEAGVKYVKNGFGDTLKTYGAGSGPYLVLPILGSSSIRDAFGFAADVFSDPFSYTLHRKTLYAKSGAVILDKRAYYLEVTDYLEQSSMDEYAAYRSLYFQKNKR